MHAVASHFTNRLDSAIITMPTGSGKTAVLIASTFRLRPIRVLVITPGRLVREQISEQFETLDVLKKTNEACGEIETVHPGYLGSQDTFYVGNLKGVGRLSTDVYRYLQQGSLC